MNSPTPGEFYLFLPSPTLSEVPSFPKSFPRVLASTLHAFQTMGANPPDFH